MNIKRTLKLLAPYLAVGLFWCLFSNAWLAILAYHAQILFWSRGSFSAVRTPKEKRIMCFVLPMVLAGPVLYLLLPHVTHTDLSIWLEDHHMSRLSLAMMIPYFGLVHPVLEQLHWGRLREETWVAHPLFAGYHMLVLYSLLSLPWLILCFVVLTAASYLWKEMAARSNSLVVPMISHVVADLGVIVAAWMLTS